MAIKGVFRQMKNEWNNYDDGERLVREATSNDSIPPPRETMMSISRLCASNRYFPNIFRMVFKRLRDHDYFRHVEKALILVEYLLKHADARFVRNCKMQILEFRKLKHYKYVLSDGTDTGGYIRRRARRVEALLASDETLEKARAKAQGREYKKPNAPKKNAPRADQNKKKKQEPSQVKKPKESKKKKAKKQPKQQHHHQQQQQKQANVPQEQAAFDGDLLGLGFDDNGQQSSVYQDDDGELLSDVFLNSLVEESNYNNNNNQNDGGKFTFGDNDDFDIESDPFEDDVFGDDIPLDDDSPEDLWMGKLTNMDNPLEQPKGKNDNKKKGGKTMAQLAATKKGGDNLPVSFNSNFEAMINMNVNEKPQQQRQQFPQNNLFQPQQQPFFVPQQQQQPQQPNFFGQPNIFAQPKQQQQPFYAPQNNNMFGNNNSMNNNDPFAYMGANQKQGGGGGGGAMFGNQFNGPVPASHLSRNNQNKDPFADLAKLK